MNTAGQENPIVQREANRILKIQNTEVPGERGTSSLRTSWSEPLLPGHETLFEYSTARPAVPDVHFQVKRAVDIFVAGLILVLLSPFLLVIVALIKIESRGPALFSQKRSLGGDDTPFDCYKFRSMHMSAEAQKDGLRHHNESDGALFKIKDDPRLTSVGRFIRKYSLDELPQLLNVLKGDMSLVDRARFRLMTTRELRVIINRTNFTGCVPGRLPALPGSGRFPAEATLDFMTW